MCKVILPRVVVSKTKTYMNHPIKYGYKMGDEYRLRYVPTCGYCEDCRLIKSRDWIVRNCFEAKNNPPTYFLTLTYSSRHLVSPYLEYRDLELFLKRLRKAGYSFRYFSCGEYGSKRLRPHFHIIMYGFTPLLDDVRFYSLNRANRELFVSRKLNLIWGKGMLWLQKCDLDSALVQYCTLYATKNGQFKRLVADYLAKKWIKRVLRPPRVSRRLNKYYSPPVVYGSKKSPFAGFGYCAGHFRKIIYIRDRFISAQGQITYKNVLYIKPYGLWSSRFVKYSVFFNKHKEKLLYSKGLGRKYFDENKKNLYSLGGCYIDGWKYGLPISYVKNSAQGGCKESLDYYNYVLLNQITDEEKMLLKKTQKYHEIAKKSRDYHVNSFDNDLDC